MTDTLSRAARSERMSRVRGKDTGPELVVRRMVHGMGFRYRVHRRDLPGNPDLVFPARRKVIFVHGCFWHRHDDPACKLARLPKSRLEFWLPKLETNARRDAEHLDRLRVLGWDTLIIWECELKNKSFLKKKLGSFISHEVN